ncbi:MAG: FecR domain-containing protein [Pedobacter sp.]|nr:FecR domain-containing protein [Pedobacter sp.]
MAHQNNEELIYELIIEDLEETIAVQDKMILQQWRTADAANERTYLEFLNVQASIDKLYGANGNADASWEVLDKKLSIPENPNFKIRAKKLNIGFYLRIAAVLLLVSSLGYYFMAQGKYAVISTSETANVTRIVLPDETIVNLNAGTKIRYNKENFLSDRDLEVLNGEVFIQVVKHAGGQFKVIAGDVEAEDIGTSFNVENQNGNVSVTVEEGKVALKHEGTNQKLLLSAGKMGTFNPSTKRLVLTDNSDLNYKSWLDKRFNFDGMVLSKVASQLEEVYQVPVVVRGNLLNNRKFTVAKLHYQTIDSALAVISASLQCKITREKGTYVLSDN